MRSPLQLHVAHAAATVRDGRTIDWATIVFRFYIFTLNYSKIEKTLYSLKRNLFVEIFKYLLKYKLERKNNLCDSLGDIILLVWLLVLFILLQLLLLELWLLCCIWLMLRLRQELN